jgi:gamma-glutamyl-gamma-aminobutyrate hydrolase PuuD
MNIAAVLRYVDMQRGEVWDDRYYITNDYMLMAKKYGIGMTAIMSEQAIEDVCRHCDGLIIQGSATDIDPKYYGGAPLPVPPVVDEYYLDSRLIKYFYEAGKPIFGICGGEQALNVYFGGTIARMPDIKINTVLITVAASPLESPRRTFIRIKSPKTIAKTTVNTVTAIPSTLIIFYFLTYFCVCIFI